MCVNMRLQIISKGQVCANLQSLLPSLGLLQISELGIAFVGLDLHSHNPLTDRTLEEVATSQVGKW